MLLQTDKNFCIAVSDIKENVFRTYIHRYKYIIYKKHEHLKTLRKEISSTRDIPNMIKHKVTTMKAIIYYIFIA